MALKKNLIGSLARPKDKDSADAAEQMLKPIKELVAANKRLKVALNGRG